MYLCKLSLLDRNTWIHVIVWKLFDMITYLIHVRWLFHKGICFRVGQLCQAALLAGGVEYTERVRYFFSASVLDMTLNHLLMRLQPGRFGECGVPFPLLPSLLEPNMVAPERVLSMGQIEQTVFIQMTDVRLWLLYNNTWNHLTVCKKKSSGSFKNVIH